jgi:hypothetical protein
MVDVVLYGEVMEARDKGEFLALCADWGDFGFPPPPPPPPLREEDPGAVCIIGEEDGECCDCCIPGPCICRGDTAVRGDSGPVYRCCGGGGGGGGGWAWIKGGAIIGYPPIAAAAAEGG